MRSRTATSRSTCPSQNDCSQSHDGSRILQLRGNVGLVFGLLYLTVASGLPDYLIVPRHVLSHGFATSLSAASGDLALYCFLFFLGIYKTCQLKVDMRRAGLVAFDQ